MGPLYAQLTGQLGAHDPSTVIFDNGKYYYFATGDLLATRSSTNLTSWSGGPAAFNALPSWIPSTVPGYSGNSLWAPDVIKLNNQYYLYYSASVWGTKLSGIGYATSPTLDPTAPNYGWTDQGKVISSTHSSPYNAIDPSLMLDKNTGKLWMTWGSFNNGIYVKEMNPANGQPLNALPGVNVAAPDRRSRSKVRRWCSAATITTCSPTGAAAAAAWTARTTCASGAAPARPVRSSTATA